MASTAEQLNNLAAQIARVWQPGDIKLKAVAHPDALTSNWAEVDEGGLLWIVANGAAWDAGKVAKYSALYAALGSPGLPANLPDWKDNFIAAPGANNGGALAAGGARSSSFTLSQANLPNYTLPNTLAVASHTHPQDGSTALTNQVPIIAGGGAAYDAITSIGGTTGATAPAITGSVTSGGSGTAKSIPTVPPYLTVGVILLKV